MLLQDDPDASRVQTEAEPALVRNLKSYGGKWSEEPEDEDEEEAPSVNGRWHNGRSECTWMDD